MGFTAEQARKASAKRWKGERARTKRDPSGPKARRMLALAELGELKVAEQRGRLVDRAKVEALVFSLARAERDAFLALPARVAATIAAELGCPAGALERALMRAIKQHLEARADVRLELTP
jgi:hypothetical protein